MTDLVIDSSVAVKWFVPEQHDKEAARIFDEYLQGNLLFLAPDLIYAEFGNILWKKQTLQGLDPIDAENIVTEFQTQISIRCISSASLLADAYQIAVAHKRTVYDSLYLALSLRENCQFVTADEKLVNAISLAFPNVIALANWP